MSLSDIKSSVEGQFYSRVAADRESEVVEQVLYLPVQLASFGYAFSWLMNGQTLLKGFRVEGNKVVFPLRTGKCPMSCVPGLRPLLWKEVAFDGDMVKIVLEGIGGAATTFIPLVTSGASKVEMERTISSDTSLKRNEVLTCTTYYPVFDKVAIGIDDTDTSTKGDTYLTAIEIGQHAELEGFGHYIKESVTLNYPLNPFKTTNNASCSMVFLVEPPMKHELIEESIEKTNELSVSKDTGIAVFEGITIPRVVIDYARRCKAKMLQVSDAEEVAKEAGIRLLNISSGERGKIGALSSIGYINNPPEAVAPSFKFRMMFRLGNAYIKFKDKLFG